MWTVQDTQSVPVQCIYKSKQTVVLCLTVQQRLGVCRLHITILIPIFWPFMTVANKTGRDHTAGELASPALLLLCNAHSLWWGSLCHEVRFIVFALWNATFPQSFYVVYATRNWSYFIKIKISCFYIFWGSSTFLLLVFHKFLNKRSILNLIWILMYMTIA